MNHELLAGPATEPLVSSAQHDLAVIGFAVGLLVFCAICYLIYAERDRELGEKMREEFEARRRRLQLDQPALQLAHEHIKYLAFERKLADDPPPVRPPPTRLKVRPQLRLVRGGQPIKFGHFDPDDAA